MMTNDETVYNNDTTILSDPTTDETRLGAQTQTAINSKAITIDSVGVENIESVLIETV